MWSKTKIFSGATIACIVIVVWFIGIDHMLGFLWPMYFADGVVGFLEIPFKILLFVIIVVAIGLFIAAPIMKKHNI